MKRATRFVLMVVLVGALFGGGVVAGVALDRAVLRQMVPSGDVPADAVAQFRLLSEAWLRVEQVYVDRAAVEPQPMIYGAISGMVDALGDTDHSTFLTPQMVQREKDQLQGHLVGIGAYVEMKDGQVIIAAPMDKSPAQAAGLRPGDIIQAVDGASVAGLSLSAVVGKITGPVDTQVTLTIQDPSSGQTHDVMLTRANIQVEAVTTQVLPGTALAHVRLAEFSNGVTDELRTTLQQLKPQGVKGVILDLRNNPGGLLDEAVGVTSLFLAQGNVLLEKDAAGQTRAIPVKAGQGADGNTPLLGRDVPLVVLINHGTASAAEIVSGALQDAGQAKVIGETTIGTGTVLQEFTLQDGSALLLAVNEWLTPKGRVIWHKGLDPDIAVALPPAVAPLFPLAERELTAQQVSQIADTQLARAISVLTP